MGNQIYDKEEFFQITKKGVSLVDFWAPWCRPCLVQAPILEEIEEELDNRVKIVKVNVQELADLAREFGVQAIPTLLLFQNGTEIDRYIGVQSKELLADAIADMLAREDSNNELQE